MPDELDPYSPLPPLAREVAKETAEKFIAALADPKVHAWCASILYTKLVEERGIAFAGSPSRIQPKVAELCEILEAYFKRELENSNL